MFKVGRDGFKKYSVDELIQKDPEGMTPFNRAVQEYTTDMVQKLVDSIPQPYLALPNHHGNTPFHTAVRIQSWDKINLLLRYMSTDQMTACNLRGQTALHEAILANKPEFAQELVRRVPKELFSAQNHDDKTPIDLASELGQHDLAKLMLDRSAALF